jgi:hypothetical protein
MAAREPRVEPDADAATERTVVAATIAAATMVAAHVIGKATRDSLFLTHFPVTRLPLAMTATSVLSGVAVSALALGMRRLGPRAVTWRVFVLQAVLFLLEWILALRSEKVASVVVYLHTGAIGGAALSAFWSVVSECFDPHTAKRVIGRIGGGAALGGALGGGLAWAASRVTSVPAMLPAMAVLSGLCAWGIGSLARASESPRLSASSERAAPSGLAALRDTPYLRLLALVVLCGALLQSLLDYALGAQAVAAYGKGTRLLSFFAVFQTAVGVFSFLVQSAATSAALERLGIGGTLALLPVSIVGLGALAAGVPSLVTTALQRGAEGVLRGSLFRSAYEVLFTPLPPSVKRATKTVIDVSFDRAGTLLGSGVILALLAVWPASALRSVTLTTLVVAGAELVLAHRLHYGYVETLAQRLRSGVIHLDLADIVDATTRKTLSQSLSSIDRTALLAQIEAARALHAESATRERPQASGETPSDERVRAVTDLGSGHAPSVRAALARGAARDPRLAPYVLELLADDRFAGDAMRALAPVASHIIGAITDLLVNEDAPARARRRAARLLGGVASERGALGLVLGLDARALDVRHACGRALVEMRTKNAALSFEAGAMLARATRELSSQSEDARSIEHVFDILSLTGPRETIELAYGALQSPDAFLKGVALEYLEVVLPVEVRTAIMPRLSVPRKTPTPPRPSARSLDDLLEAKDTIRLHLDELRRSRDPDTP